MDALHKILELLWKSGESEVDFCNAIGINKSAVTDWKKGKTASYKRHLPKIAAHFGVQVEFFTEKPATTNMGQPVDEITLALLNEIQDLNHEEAAKVQEFAQLLKLKRNQEP